MPAIRGTFRRRVTYYLYEMASRHPVALIATAALMLLAIVACQAPPATTPTPTPSSEAGPGDPDTPETMHTLTPTPTPDRGRPIALDRTYIVPGDRCSFAPYRMPILATDPGDRHYTLRFVEIDEEAASLYDTPMPMPGCDEAGDDSAPAPEPQPPQP